MLLHAVASCIISNVASRCGIMYYRSYGDPRMIRSLPVANLYMSYTGVMRLAE